MFGFIDFFKIRVLSLHTSPSHDAERILVRRRHDDRHPLARDALGAEQVTKAAAELGTDENSLLGGLQAALPQLVDKASSDGSLLDSVGGFGGLSGMAKKFL